MNRSPKFRTSLKESAQTLRDIGVLPNARPFFKYCNGTQRQQPDHGADLEALRQAIRQPEHIVEKSILLVPHASVARVEHRGSNPQKMLDELLAHVEIGRPFLRQLHGDL